jgi:predicted nucleic acid-binding protein
MIRIFVDASVLFAAALSATGGSREIVRRGIRGDLELVISDFVIEEARRNRAAKRPDMLAELEVLCAAVPFTVVDATARQVKAAAAFTPLKDAPIVAAAKRARVQFHVSLDRKHLVGKTEIEERSALRIILPETFLAALRNKETPYERN